MKVRRLGQAGQLFVRSFARPAAEESKNESLSAMPSYLPYSSGFARRGTEEFLVLAIRVAAIFLLLACVSYGQAVYVPNYTTSNVSGYLADPPPAG